MQNRRKTILLSSKTKAMLIVSKKYFLIVIMAFITLISKTATAQNINTPNKIGPMGVEVNTKTGNLFLSRTDFYIPARQLDFDITFAYNSCDFDQNTGYGNGWTFMYNMKYKTDTSKNITIVWGDGREDVYTSSNGQFNPPVGFFDTLTQYQAGKYLLRTKEGLKLYFDDSTHKRLTKTQEPNGNFLNFVYTDTLMTAITNGAGQTLIFQYNAGKLSSITDANATPMQAYVYSYDAYGNLTKVTDPQGGTYKYTYLVNGPMSSITDKNNNVADLIYYSDFSARELISCNSRTAFSYDSTTRTTTAIDFLPTSSNQTTTYVYNEQGWLSKFIGSCCGMNITFAYDNSGNLTQRTDANGNVYKYTYDNKGNYLTITDPLNNTTTFSYTADFNQIAGITDPLGNLYSFNYDANGNLTQTNSPANQQRIFTYGSNGDLLSAKDANNNISTITYDAYGYPQKINLPLNTAVQSTFDARGNLLSAKDANGNNYSFQYDSLNQLKTITDPLNQTNSFTYDKAGNLISFTDAKGLKQFLSYDASNRVVSYKDQKGAVSSFAYDAMDNLVQFTDALGKVTTLTYDNQNRLSTITDAVGNGYSFNYDLVGNMISASLPNGNTVNYTYDALNRIINGTDIIGSLGQLTYDKNGNVTSYTNAAGSSIQFTYDNLNRIAKVTDPLGNSRAFSYDNNDNLLTMKDRNGHISSYTYNALDRVTSYSDNNNNTVSVQYDSYGNITSATDQNGNTTNYQYDALNRPFKLTYPDGSNIVATYDNNSDITSVKLADGSTINYTYDSTNRLIAKDLPGGEHYSYTYDTKGRLLSASNAAGVISFAYDDIDHLILENFNAHITSYNYNVPQRVVTVVYPNGTTVTKTFDQRTRLSNLAMNNQQLTSYQFNTINELTQKTYANGISTNYQYDINNRLTSISSSQSSLPSMTFQYDNEGNKLSVARTNDPQYSETFSYDNNYRLINYKQGTLNGSSITNPVIQNSYTYDAVGNRTAANLNGLNTSYTVNNLNQLTHLNNSNQNIAFTYDGNGNQTFDGQFYMRYDAQGRKLVDSSASFVYHYAYDALGRRVLKSVNGVEVNYYYSGLKQIEERDAADIVTGSQVFEASYMPLMRINNSQKYFYHLNDLNSTEAITDSTGNLIEHYRYEDFGKTTMYDMQNNNIASSTFNNRFLYTGQEYDAQTSKYNFHFRNYDPTTGNFDQRDPIGYSDQMGVYQYVGNNPGSFIDPFGLAPCPPEEQTWDDWGAFWGGQMSNLGSWLQVHQSMLWEKQIEMILKQPKNASRPNRFILRFKVTDPGSPETALTKFGKAVNSTPATWLMLPVNMYNTYESGKGLINSNNGIDRLDNGLNFVSAGSTTAVGLTSLAAPSSLTATGLATAPAALPAAVATAGGLAIYGLADLGFRGVTGAAGMVGMGDGSQSIIGFSSSHEIPVFTSGIRAYYEQLGASEDLGVMMYHRNVLKDLEKWNWVRFKMEWRQRFNRMRRFSLFGRNDCPPNGDKGTQIPPIHNFNDLLKFLTELIFNHDPNEIIGPDGVGTKKWVSVNDRLPYQILFENDSNATAPVKVVKVYYPIDPKQDVNTFQLGSFGFNNLTFSVPAGVNSYYQRLDVRDSLGLYVDVTAGIDGVNHQAFWIFQSIDPITQLPTTDPLKGFLLTKDTANPTHGNGYVNFSIKPINTAHTGDTMSAQAFIVFDANDTLPTNHAWNTIDAVAPTTQIGSATTTNIPGSFKLSWKGQDDAAGSGLAGYSLYVSPNGAPFYLYRSNIADTSLLFTGATDSTYCFFVTGVDSVNNQQPPSNHCDLSVTPQSGGSPLPLTWLDFTGTRRGNDALLLWSTANEINTKAFDVERSLNGTQFMAIGTVGASGNTNNIHNYSYTDANIVNLGVNVIYYRIKEVDKDGKFSYSKIIALRIDKLLSQPLITAVPNPFDRVITLKVVPVTDQDKTNTVELYSLQGILLYRKEIEKTGTSTTILSDLPNLASGIYILKTTINGIQYTSKMMKN